jgi:hypothetical protein
VGLDPKGRQVSRLGTGRLTIMGEHMLAVMESRGIPSWRALSDKLAQRTGRIYGTSRISNWAYGRHPVSLEFARDFVFAMDLDARERGAWHEAFLFGHDAYSTEQAPATREAV